MTTSQQPVHLQPNALQKGIWDLPQPRGAPTTKDQIWLWEISFSALFFQKSCFLCHIKMKPTIKTSGYPCLSPTSTAAGGLSHLSQVSDGVSLGHAVEQIHQVAGPKAGSQAKLQVYSQNLEESLY